jgi:hypothetical protein
MPIRRIEHPRPIRRPRRQHVVGGAIAQTRQRQPGDIENPDVPRTPIADVERDASPVGRDSGIEIAARRQGQRFSAPGAVNPLEDAGPGAPRRKEDECACGGQGEISGAIVGRVRDFDVGNGRGVRRLPRVQIERDGAKSGA